MGILCLLAKKRLDNILTFIVAFAAGTMLATSFFHLMPESFEAINTLWPVLIGIVIFFILESVIHWHHSHELNCANCTSPTAYLNLIGDGLHNFIDGLIIAASFLINPITGILVTISIMLHEIPQEIGDFAILIHSGFSKTQAIITNLISALVAVLGGIFGYFFFSRIEFAIPYAIGIAAGSFIYIATSDLFPILHKEKNKIKKIIQTIALIIGILLMWIILSIHLH